jgi:uncharacterized protein (TIGR02246 family)
MSTSAIVMLVFFWSMNAVVPGAGQGAADAKKPGAAGGNADIRQISDAYVKAVLAGDAKAVAALYTEDAIEMPPNVPGIKGRAAIEQYYAKILSGPVKVGQFTLTHIESRAAGDIGYEVGTYRQTFNPPSQTGANTETGKYTVILKRVQGAWKVAYAIYNADQAR